MRIWFTEIGEPLPIEENARLFRYGMLTKALALQGHEVVWWTSSFSHTPKKHFVDRDSDIMVGGVTLKILKGPGYRKNVSVARVRHQQHFAETFYGQARNQRLPDIIISPVPTIEVAEMAVRFSREHRIPILIDIRDEWPDEFVDLAPKPLQGIVKWLLCHYFKKMHQVCRGATGIIAVSRSFLDYGLYFANREKSENDNVFPIGYSTVPVSVDKVMEAMQFWRKQGIHENAFICCFFGTIGKFFDLEMIMKSAGILSREFDIQFVLCGDGSSLEKYKKMASGMDSVLFPGWVDASKIEALMELSDVGLAPYAKNTRMSLPNKPFEYFAGSLPVVSSIQGEMKEILVRHQCGRTYDPDSVDELCAILRELYAAEPLRKEMGRHARQLIEREFSIEHIAAKLGEHITRVVRDFRNIRLPMDR